jgi:hypothetical protein
VIIFIIIELGLVHYKKKREKRKGGLKEQGAEGPGQEPE